MKIDVLNDTMTKADADRLAARGDFYAAAVESSRRGAEALVDRVPGARLVVDTQPEVIVSEGTSALVGDVVLVAMRWTVEVPDDFHPAPDETLDALRT